MPELPEVETIVREIRGRVMAAVIEAATLRRRDYVRTKTAVLGKRLKGRRIEEIRRDGKWITIRLDDGARLVLHLGMSGRIYFERRGATLQPHTHFIVQFANYDFEMRMRDARRFGGIWYYADGEKLGGKSAIGGIHRLGVDALRISTAQLAHICRRRRQIKALLMDQSAIGGLGNIYCDEALFDAGIHPLSLAGELTGDEVAKLAASIRSKLKNAIRLKGSSMRDYVRADGSKGGFQRRHLAYGKEGKPCVRCGAAIERRTIAGRSTHFCPSCQIVGTELTKAWGGKQSRRSAERAKRVARGTVPAS
ncbi:MAG TPA: bifunctional DNA-formamidopyrimidine glycosylase/DNA-(apurinic or apyrimidinic site) lyase [Phycisphaerae bacterium]|nr:bifunctional DNA-formamidopyrimidine glycosylase/DNA-(apurinic or apyrimidinic site) lyase [Phycisphaerae bacterium]